MLITENVRLNRILSGTWKNFVFSIAACSIAYIINELFVKNLFSFPVFIPTVLGTALAFFIGFNNNQAYDRWWEARKIWGSLINNSRTFARELISYTTHNNKEGEQKEDPTFIKEKLITRHIAFLYILKNSLRNTAHENHLNYLSAKEIEIISTHSNQPNALLLLQSYDLNALYNNEILDGFRFIEINHALTAFGENMGKAERIKNTVFPTTYYFYAKNFIWIFIYCVTMAMGNSIGMWSILFGSLLGYVFFTIQAIGQKLVNPFEKDNIMGIPLDQMTRTVEITLLEMLDKKEIPNPIVSANADYVM